MPCGSFGATPYRPASERADRAALVLPPSVGEPFRMRLIRAAASVALWVGIAVPPAAGAEPHVAPQTPGVVSTDFDGDGFADTAIGAAFEDVDGHNAAGAVNVVYGSATGLGPDRNQFWTQ